MDEVGLLRLGAGTGGCFMMIGSAEGSSVPWSFSFMSFIAIENSSLSIFPSLFISARVLRDRGNREASKRSKLKWCASSIDSSESLCVCLSPYLGQHWSRQPWLEEKLPCLLPYRKRQKHKKWDSPECKTEKCICIQYTTIDSMFVAWAYQQYVCVFHSCALYKQWLKDASWWTCIINIS